MGIPNVQQFTQDLPEFNNQAQYPQATIKFWLEVADLMLSPRWDDANVAQNTQGATKTMRYIGVELFTAHHLVLAGRDLAAAKRNGGPGIASSTGVGVVAAKSVDEVSISYDAAASSYSGAGHWNLTTYGTRFYALYRIVGAGGLQLGIGSGVLDPRVPVPSPVAPWWGPMVDLGAGEF